MPGDTGVIPPAPSGTSLGIDVVAGDEATGAEDALAPATETGAATSPKGASVAAPIMTINATTTRHSPRPRRDREWALNFPPDSEG